MPDPRITQLKAEAAKLSACAASARMAAKLSAYAASARMDANYAERGGLHELDDAASLEGVARNVFAQVSGMEKGRKRDLQMIHIARKDIAMTDDSYRSMLKRLTGLTTAADMVAHQRRKVIAEFCSFGWNPKGHRARVDAAGKAVPDSTPSGQQSKILALWEELADAGAVKDRSSHALSAYCLRMTLVARLEWLDSAQASRVIEALKQWIKRTEEDRM
jgi:phage gp16-like protein